MTPIQYHNKQINSFTYGGFSKHPHPGRRGSIYSRHTYVFGFGESQLLILFGWWCDSQKANEAAQDGFHLWDFLLWLSDTDAKKYNRIIGDWCHITKKTWCQKPYFIHFSISITKGLLVLKFQLQERYCTWVISFSLWSFTNLKVVVFLFLLRRTRVRVRPAHNPFIDLRPFGKLMLVLLLCNQLRRLGDRHLWYATPTFFCSRISRWPPPSFENCRVRSFTCNTVGTRWFSPNN